MDTTNSSRAPRQIRRRRPHPAQRARKIAGSVSVVGMLALTAGLAALTNPKTSTTAVSPTAASAGQSSYALSRSFTAAAVPANVSSQAITSSHGS
ncbi:MAG: hypothetical protein ACLPVY_13925 [Acidimicrobiia bacterium]